MLIKTTAIKIAINFCSLNFKYLQMFHTMGVHHDFPFIVVRKNAKDVLISIYRSTCIVCVCMDVHTHLNATYHGI